MNKKSKEFKQRNKYMIPIDGKLYETTEEVYQAYYSMDRRERYLEERDKKEGVMNFSTLDNDKYSAEETISDQEIDIEEEVTNKILVEAVLEVINHLEEEDKWLIQELFFNWKSEVQLAKESGIARTTIRSRKEKVFSKIKKIVKN